MEGKKSFVLYTDLMDIVNDLSDEQAGKLVKLIVNYVNDRNPECEDQLIKIAFKPIKSMLKRDLEKWESIKHKRSEAGKRGGRPRKQDKANKANALFEKQTEAKKAVNVNVNVNDNVNVDKSICTVSDAYSLFDKHALSGRFFSKMNTVHGLNEKVIQEEFLKWKQVNEGQNFQNEKHLQNSFNNWLRNYKPPRGGTTDATISVLPMNNRKSRNPQ